MSRTKRFLGGVSVGYAHQIAVTAVGIWLTPFLLSRLGAHDYGLWLTGTQLIAYLTLLDVGVLALLPRETAYATGRAGGVHTAGELPEVIGRAARIVVWQMPIIALATFGAWWLLPAGWRELRLPMAVLLGAFLLTYPLRLFQATLQGLQDLAFAGTLQLVAWGLGTIVTVSLVFAGWRLPALAAGAMLTQVVSLVGCAWRVRVRFPSALPSRIPRLRWREAVGYVQRAGWVSVSQIAQVLLYSTDMLIVAWVFGPVTVVPYACTQKLISVLSNQPQVLTQAAAPALSELRMGATREKLFAVTSSLSLALMLGSGAVLSVVLAVNRAFVSWWVGPDQYGGAVLTGLFAAAMLVRHWNVALVYSLFSFGHERRISITTVADGVVTLILSLTLARTVGVMGVPLGFLGGALLVSIPANLVALARDTGVSPAHFALALRPWAVRLALLLPVAGAMNVFIRSASVLTVAGAALAMGAVYSGLMLPVALRPPLGDYVRRVLAPVCRLLGIPLAPAAEAALPQEAGRGARAAL
jgi:O-antigen/teichoic acid export membrane protein